MKNTIYIYGEKVDIFGRSDKMMKNKWNSACTKTTKNGFSTEYFVLYSLKRTFTTENFFPSSSAKRGNK